MWTQAHRAAYRREGEGYPSDLRDAEWARLEPLIPWSETQRATGVAYYGHNSFTTLRPTTQRLRRAILERFRAEHGEKRIVRFAVGPLSPRFSAS